MNVLYLHLSDADGPAQAWLSREDGLADLGRGDVAAFAQQHSGSPAVVFLPSTRCLFATAPVTARQLRQAGEALGWLVEDQAGEDADALHVVAAPGEGDSTALLAINRKDLAALLQDLRGAGLHPVAVLPDLFLLPRDDSDWQLRADGGRLLLRTAAFAGAALEADALELMLGAARAERGAAALLVSIAAGDPDVARRVEQWASMQDGVQCRLGEGLEAATAIAAGGDWTRHPANLLQGSFASRARLALPTTLRWAAVFLAAAFLLQLLSEWAHYGVYRYQGGKVATEAVARYRTLYPDERLPAAVPAAYREVQKRMRGKRNEGRDDVDALPALTRLAQALQGSGLSTQRIDVQGGVVTLDVDARSLGELDGFKQRLVGAGFSSEIVSANNQGGLIRGRLRVEGGA